jgi:hypothetical protein
MALVPYKFKQKNILSAYSFLIHVPIAIAIVKKTDAAIIALFFDLLTIKILNKSISFCGTILNSGRI